MSTIKIPIAVPAIGSKELVKVKEAVESGWVSSKGKFIEEFEQRFADFCGAKYGIATSNGTAALHLALSALGIGKGDEVIIPTFTFVATANTVRYTGAKPVFVDSTKDCWCINPLLIEEKITSRTKAIIPVHLYGHPSDMDPILKIARKHHLYVIEDAAEAHGAEYKGIRVGSLGTIGCFSFYGNKIITTGEGGMCVTNNKRLAQKMMILRDHGMNPKKRYWYDVIGFNYRMTNLQAALGVAQLERINDFIKKKRQIASWYKDGLHNLAQKGSITVHPELAWAKCVYWMYSILIERNFGKTRNQIITILERKGIETRPFFYPIHTLPPYRKFANNNYPVAEDIAKRGINLPSAVSLIEKDINQITLVIRKMYKYE